MLSAKQIDAVRKRERKKYNHTYFAKEYWKEDLAGYSGNRGLSYADNNHVERFKIITDALKENIRFKSVLDAGCGPGLLLKALKEDNYKLTGVDVSQDALELACELLRTSNKQYSDIKLLISGLEKLPLEEKEFDLVVCLDVLEHLPFFDVEETVNELFRVCSKTLVLTINTDNPYEYHPTILSLDTWREILSAQEDFKRNEPLENALTSTISSVRPEYDFYCYNRIK